MFLSDDFFQNLKICHKNAEKLCKTNKRGKPTSRQFLLLFIYSFFLEKIKNVFEWIFMKGRISIYADTTASLEKEHIDK